MSRLDAIIAQKRSEVEALRRSMGDEQIQALASAAAPPRGFRSAVRNGRPSVIAEVKRASPSRGVLGAHVDPVDLAKRYVAGGADAISVLTDEQFFSGSKADLIAVRTAVAAPVLRKDFVVDAIQVHEARSIGADAILLIARVLDDRALRDLREQAARWGMDALVETHTDDEVRRAVASGADLIGVNNRDLSTFQVDLATSERLRALIPSSLTAVSESGVMTPDDASRMFRAGYDAVLVGEGVVTAEDPAAAVRRLKDHASTGPLR